MKKIGIGREFYSDFVENNNYYVDKTAFIKTVFNQDNSSVLLITRPRRFGKTLTMNTFYEFLRINSNDIEDNAYHEKLFKDTKIYEDKEFCQKYMGKFPVIFITLKDVIGNTYELAYNQLFNVIVSLVNNNFSYLLSSNKLNDFDKRKLLKIADEQYYSHGLYKSDIKLSKYDIKDNETTIHSTLENSLRYLTECLSKHHGVKPILLIDEYDVPISKAAHFGYYDKMIPLISSFLSNVLKTNPYLEKAVLTGCLRAAKESIFTGLNNLNICSILDRGSLEFSKGIGFTKEETNQVLNYYNLSNYKDLVQENYDGYYFGREHMYCPWDVMNFCNYNKNNVEECKEDIEVGNYWINTSGNDVIEEYMGYIKPEHVDLMQDLVDGKAIKSVVRTSLCYGDLKNHNIEDFWTLLLYTGYLTSNPKSVKIDESTNGEYVCDLYIPNNEIKSCFRSKILNFIKQNPLMKNYTTELVKGLFNGESKKVEDNINNLLAKYVSIRDFAVNAPKENYYHGFMNGLLVNSSTIIQEQNSNMESGNGYVDILVKSKINNVVAIIELKQISNELQSKMLKAEEAIKQIKTNNYAEIFLSNPDIQNVYVFGICFCKKQCSVVAEKLK